MAESRRWNLLVPAMDPSSSTYYIKVVAYHFMESLPFRGDTEIAAVRVYTSF